MLEGGQNAIERNLINEVEVMSTRRRFPGMQEPFGELGAEI